jgi:myo-inositol-1(or 4)-monophosphatase
MTTKDKKNLIKAAHASGKVLRKYFGKALTIVEKSTAFDLQTEADLGSEKVILKILKAEFPKYNIHSEEQGEINNKSDYTIVIDPLDGTNNFVLGIPNFTVSIAILYKNESIAGVVYQPIIDKTYFAEKGKGAFLGKRKINVNNVTDYERITIGYGCGYQTKRDYLSQLINALHENTHKRILLNWSPAYDFCMLASGKIESLISDNWELYDYAAGKLIAIEAGAKIIDFTGKKEDNFTNSKFIASNGIKTSNYILGIIKPQQKRRK